MSFKTRHTQMLYRGATRLYSTISRQFSKQNRTTLKWVLSCSALASGSAGYYYYYENYFGVELSPDHFTKYKISYKKDIDSDHYLMELAPLKPQKKNLWSELGSSKLWSVEIKQPQIMVVRNYTPLPLKRTGEDELQVLKDCDNAQGKLFFYMKQYKNGEVARWLNRLPEGHVLEVRGPFVEYEFPELKDEIRRDRSFLWEGKNIQKTDAFRYQPFDISMYTAGTGVVTALQLLLTESPFRGKIELFHACKSVKELGPLEPLLYTLKENGRVDLKLFESSKGTGIKNHLSEVLDMIPKPFPYFGEVQFKSIEKDFKPVLSLVCGPQEYITTIAGVKYDLAQGPVGGLLAKKGWTSENVYKLS